MRARGTTALAAVIGILAMATLDNSGQDRPKEGEPSIPPSHGVGVLFGSVRHFGVESATDCISISAT